MKPLWLHGVTGLYHEFYQPDTQALVSTIKKIEKNILDSGIIFWSTLLQPERIIKVVNALEENIHNPIHQIPQFLGVAADKTRFISNVLDYRISICDQGIEAIQFFKKLETLAILCDLYSRFEFYPFQLSIQNGFFLDEVSAKEIVYNCQSVSHNPHIAFINDAILPLVLDHSPDVIFCTGRISYFHIALAKMVKTSLSDVHICFTRHSSEYYSLNKITKYLRNNTVLFSMIDSIILENFDESEQLLLESMKLKGDISEIPNLLTLKKQGEAEKIKHRTIKKPSTSIVIGRKKQVSGLKITPETIFDIHFDPYVKCYWNKCVFCGINKKYTHEDCIEVRDQIEIKLKKLCRQLPEKSFLWFIDEAIHPSKLEIIAEHFISNNHKFAWQARCRINHDLLSNGLPGKLAQSGLKELRLGLESASIRVLRLMNKFEDGFKLKLVQQIVKTYSNYGISIHFPMIIGFPGEDVADRQKTYEFLSILREKCQLVTFNINIFNFDISSPLFKKWDNYAISSIVLPCSPSEYIGNIITWDDPTKTDDQILERERNAFMRNKLYQWMPPKALITPTIFYRLSETIRNTLVWKDHKYVSEDFAFSLDKIIQRSPELVVQKKADGEYLAYNWGTHHYIEGSEMMLKILNTWVLPKSIEQGIKELSQDKNEAFQKSDIAIMLKKLLHHGHFVPVGYGSNDRDEFSSFYDTLYFFNSYPYTSRSDKFLLDYKDELIIGRVLDLGVGRGKSIPDFLSLGFSVHGIDISSKAIERLKDEYPENNCKFELSDLRQISFEPDAYTLVICSMVLSHLRDDEQRRLAVEIDKALQIGGSVFIRDLSDKDPMRFENNHRNIRNIFSKEKLLRLFTNYKTVVLSNDLTLEEKRYMYGGYFDLWHYLGRKTI